MAATPFAEHNFIYDFTSNIAGRKCNTYCCRVLMLKTSSGNIMMIQAYFQGQKGNLKVNFFAKICNLILAGESCSGIIVIMQGYRHCQKSMSREQNAKM